jgi:hypothetical protein
MAITADPSPRVMVHKEVADFPKEKWRRIRFIKPKKSTFHLVCMTVTLHFDCLTTKLLLSGIHAKH